MRGASDFLACLEQSLGRPGTELELYEFGLSFDAALALGSPSEPT